jgi:hypothetical protein
LESLFGWDKFHEGLSHSNKTNKSLKKLFASSSKNNLFTSKQNYKIHDFNIALPIFGRIIGCNF